VEHAIDQGKEYSSNDISKMKKKTGNKWKNIGHG
jgi:hypothetical protein